MFKNLWKMSIIILVLWGNVSLAAERYKLAVIFPGAVQDKDYNMIGYQAMKHAERQFEIETVYSQRVSVADTEKIIRQHISDDFSIIWAHGGQYVDRIINIAPNYPEATFIIEGDEPMEHILPNIIVLGGREYHKSYYVLGALAAKLTTTGHVGYVGGMELPFTYGEINAAWQAVQQYNPQVKFHYLHVGDFNDPLNTRLVAEALISQGCDVLLSGVNLGNFGLFEAIKKAPHKVFFTTTYTSKSGYAPQNYLCSDIVNYILPIEQVLGDIIHRGIRSGYYPVSWGEGQARYISFPIQNVSAELNQEIQQIAKEVAAGKIAVAKILDRVVIEE